MKLANGNCERYFAYHPTDHWETCRHNVDQAGGDVAENW